MSVYTAQFAKAAAKANPPAWQRSSYQDYLRKAGDVVRVTEDRKLLRALMRKAKKSPTAQSALAWAKAHDIKIIVDRTTNAGGYYNNSTGVVAVSLPALKGLFGPYYDVEVLVHEIRHAWQDHKNMLPTSVNYSRGNLGETTIRQALYEADAYAHGKLANAECQGVGRHAQQTLRYWFHDWYAGTRADTYGSKQRETHGSLLGLTRRKAPSYNTEMKGVFSGRAQAGLNPWRREDIEKLGHAFNGGNYLAGWKNDALWKRILSPASAICQFVDDIRNPDPLAMAVRKSQLRTRLNFGRHHRILTVRGHVPKVGGKDF